MSLIVSKAVEERVIGGLFLWRHPSQSKSQGYCLRKRNSEDLE